MGTECSLSALTQSLCLCVHARIYMCIFTWKPEDNLGHCPWELFILFFGQCLSLTWSSPIRLCCLASQLQGCSCLCLPITRVTSTHHHAWLFMRVHGSLCSHSQHSTDGESPAIWFGLSYIRNLREILFSAYSYRLGFGCVQGHGFVECALSLSRTLQGGFIQLILIG